MRKRRGNGKHGRLPPCPQIEAEIVQNSHAAPSLAELSGENKENVAPSILLFEKTSTSGPPSAEMTSTTKPATKGLAYQEPVADVSDKGETFQGNPQDKYIEIKSTPDRGIAVFASRKIKAGTLILSERPLLSLCKDEEDDHSAVQREFSKLSRATQKRYLKLFDAEKSRMPRVASIYYSNCYNLDPFALDGRGGSAMGDLSSRFNHSCIPNVQFSYDFDQNQMMFYAIRDIPRGKEVCSSYEKKVFEIAIRRRQKLQMYYAFVCRCEACEGGNKNEFWARSDERRTAMLDAFKHVQDCERIFLKENVENDESSHGQKEGAIDEARSALGRLETLLLKEGLTGVVLANTYRSLSKWSERKQLFGEAVKWKEMERHHCEIGLGAHALRTKEAEKKLAELQQILSV